MRLYPRWVELTHSRLRQRGRGVGRREAAVIVTASTTASAGGFTFRALDEEEAREYLAVQRRAPGHSRCGPAAPEIGRAHV